MIQGNKVLGIIPARGGSKGIPRKNIKMLAGKPLITRTIEEAKKSKYIDKLILSSEDKEIITIAQNNGLEVPFIRPKELAKDDSQMIDVVLHAIENCTGYQIIAVLQPTSPFRTVTDIDNCIEKMIKEKSHSCVTIVESKKSPYWMFNIDSKNRLSPILSDRPTSTNRQDNPKVYLVSGDVYVAFSSWLIEKRVFVDNSTVGNFVSYDSCPEIDNIVDFEIVEFLINK
jgi:N-acylneuraminate cytidylyltransferase